MIVSLLITVCPVRLSWNVNTKSKITHKNKIKLYNESSFKLSWSVMVWLFPSDYWLVNMPGFESRWCFYTSANSSDSSWCQHCHRTCSSTTPCCASLSTAYPSFGTFCQHDQLPLHGSELHIYAISLPADLCW